MKRVRWSITEVFKAISLAEQIWRSLNHADWCARQLMSPDETSKWHKNAQEAVERLKKMGLEDLVETIIRMRH